MKRFCLVALAALSFLAACETDASLTTASRVCVSQISGSARDYLRDNANQITRDVSDRNIFILRDGVSDSAVIAHESQSGRCDAGERTLTGEEWQEEIAARSAANPRNEQSCAFHSLNASNQQMHDLIYDLTLSGLGGAAYSGVDGEYSLNVGSDCELAEPFVHAYLSRREITRAVRSQ